MVFNKQRYTSPRDRTFWVALAKGGFIIWGFFFNMALLAPATLYSGAPEGGFIIKGGIINTFDGLSGASQGSCQAARGARRSGQGDSVRTKAVIQSAFGSCSCIHA